MSVWNADTVAGSAGLGAVTMVEGSSFCVSSASGEMSAPLHHGVYFRDTRFISDWKLLINDQPVTSLAAMTYEPYRAVFVGRALIPSGRADTPLIVERSRSVGTGLREELSVRNYSGQSVSCTLDLEVGADFADLFEVKGDAITHRWRQNLQVHGDELVIESEWGGHERGLRVHAPGASIVGDHIGFSFTIAPRGQWSTTIIATPTIDDEDIVSGFPAHVELHDTHAARRYRDWGMDLPVRFVGDPDIQKTIVRSNEDLGSLRIYDPLHPERQVVAAGAPWFMALFGRDALLTSYMTVSIAPKLALGTLQTLADHQGKLVDARSEEQPGRILHEVRLGLGSGRLIGQSTYYGSIDATPLFVALLGELRRWGCPRHEIAQLLPAADKALDWIRDYGDRDQDGFVEYERSNEQGIINQGWKDSWDGISFADGSLAEPPIALCEVQGYVYSAYLARALLAKDLGDEEEAEKWIARAIDLKERFNEAFWLPDRGYFAIALDRDKCPVDARASNMGYCLWSGIVDEDKAAAVADHLVSPEMFSGWGVRTLASDMGAYNPASYHNGSVWPHDNALIVAGLMRYGLIDQAKRIAFGILDAAASFGGRLPELFCGFDRSRYPDPVPYPTSCSPQAWAAAAPVLIMRSLARLDPCVPNGDLWIAPAYPEEFGPVYIENLPLAGARVSIDYAGNRVRVEGLPDGITLHPTPRPLKADLLESLKP